jgi:hypothetical protein
VAGTPPASVAGTPPSVESPLLPPDVGAAAAPPLPESDDPDELPEPGAFDEHAAPTPTNMVIAKNEHLTPAKYDSPAKEYNRIVATARAVARLASTVTTPNFTSTSRTRN